MKPVLIIENQTNALKVNESNSNKKNYVLDGPFTDFEVVNRNNRIYTADEFVPHLERMMEKKKWGVIYGEMDHPENFDISLKCVSHLIENAFYNKERNGVDGEIRLLSTHYGKDAKALVDDGLPLFVSSRAAGVTESNGNVKLNQLFTYDLVADPGFASARMQVKTMNESLGLPNDSNYMIIESNKNQLSQLASKYEKQSSIRNIIDFTDETKTNELFNMNKNDNVTRKQISDWSKHVVSEMNKTKINLEKEIKESKNIDDKKIEELLSYQERLQENVAKIEDYLDYLATKVAHSISSTELLEKKTDKLVGYTNYLGESLDKAIVYSNYLAENLDNSIEYSNYLGEGLDKAIDYTNYLAENLDKTIDYSQYIAENLTNNIKYTEYLAENLDKTIEYSQYIAENLDTNIGYANYLAENLDTNIGFSEYLSENLESTINYADYISECVDKTLEFSNSIVESLNKSKSTMISEKLSTADEFLKTLSIKEAVSCDSKIEKEEGADNKASRKIKDLKSKKSDKKSEEEEENVIYSKEDKKKEKEDVKESATLKGYLNDKSDLSILSKLDNLIEEAKKREASKAVRPNFYEFLSADDVKHFESLTDSEQENVKVAMNETTGYYSRHDVLSIMRQVLEKGKPSDEQVLIDNMPTEIKTLWEKVDVKTKKSILAQSKFYDVSSTELMESFWATRNFGNAINEGRILIKSDNPFENIDKLSESEVDYFSNRFKNLK
jgi:hypothetical protein